jgi:hypothetical protein
MEHYSPYSNNPDFPHLYELRETIYEIDGSYCDPGDTDEDGNLIGVDEDTAERKCALNLCSVILSRNDYRPKEKLIIRNADGCGFLHLTFRPYDDSNSPKEDYFSVDFVYGASLMPMLFIKTADEMARWLFESAKSLENDTDRAALYEGVELPNCHLVRICDGAGNAYVIAKHEELNNAHKNPSTGIIPTLIRIFDNESQTFKTLRNWGPTKYPVMNFGEARRKSGMFLQTDEVCSAFAEFWQTEYNHSAPGLDKPDTFIGR